MDQPETGHFGDRLIGRIRQVGHPLCVGLDPYLDRIPALFSQGSMAPGDPATAAAVTGFLTAVIDRLPGRVAAVKPQMALFEVMGWRGLQALEKVVDHARARRLLVLLDGKRGDIGAVAAGYARAYLGPDAAIAGDALTVNPYLGPDTLRPFVTGRADGRGLFVCVRTSNPDSACFQDTETADGEPFHQRVARALAGLVEDERGPETGWSAVGVVVGATWPDQARRLRQMLPRAPFLIPGYGAQGAGAGVALAGLVAGPHGLEGGLVNTARSVLFPHGAESATAPAWEAAIDDTLSRTIGDLQAAMAVAEPAAAD